MTRSKVFVSRLKVPHARLIDEHVLKDFRNEARLAAQLDHPNILPLKDASIIDEHLVIALPLGEKSLADRLRSRMSFEVAVDLAEQLLEAVAYAHHTASFTAISSRTTASCFPATN